MKNAIVALAAALALAGCYKPEDHTGRVMQELIYTKDPRTGLCFAVLRPFRTEAVMSIVPCTPEVEMLIKVGAR